MFCRIVALLSNTVTVWTLQSLEQFLILFKLKSCKHLFVRDTEIQTVSDFVFDTSLDGRHETRSGHLGVHPVVPQLSSCVRLTGRPLVSGLLLGDFSGSVRTFGAKSGLSDGRDYCANGQLLSADSAWKCVLGKTATSDGVGVVRGYDKRQYLLQDSGAAGPCTPHTTPQLRLRGHHVNCDRSESLLNVDHSEIC